MAWTDFWDVTGAVHFFVFCPMLVVVVGLQCKFGSTHSALEASTMEKSEVLQWTNSINLVNDLVASEAGALVEIRPIHGFGLGAITS